MNRETKGKFNLGFRTRRANSPVIAVTISVALGLGALMPVVADTKSKTTSAGLSENQKIIHLINRIGYASRPGIGAVQLMRFARRLPGRLACRIAPRVHSGLASIRWQR